MAAYVNIGSYYFIGIPIGIFLGWILKLGVLVHSTVLFSINEDSKMTNNNKTLC